MTRAAVVGGIGGYLPGRVVTNAELAEHLDTTDEWIRSRTGIAQRHIVAENEATSDLAIRAGRAALDSAGTDSADVVVVATATPDHSCPATAPAVAAGLGLPDVAAFDVGAVCTGFVYALAVANGLIVSGTYDTALVIGADCFSTITDPADRTTRAIFGDGAGALLLRSGSRSDDGALLGFDLGSDGSRKDHIVVPAGGSRQRSSAVTAADEDFFFLMKGNAVFMQAVLNMAGSSRAVLKEADWQLDDVRHLVAHQANSRILDATAVELGLPVDRVVSNIAGVGNTVAASVPLALRDAADAGRLRAGDRVLLTAFGGGLTWGSAALTWPALPPATSATPSTTSEREFS